MRVMKRDGLSRQEILARMENQSPEEDLIPYADYVISNDGVKPLLPQVLTVWKTSLYWLNKTHDPLCRCIIRYRTLPVLIFCPENEYSLAVMQPIVSCSALAPDIYWLSFISSAF
jgi:hypothetical protein